MEEKGIATIILSPTPEFNRELGFPRTVAVEYPYGRPLGEVNDREGQRKVLLDVLKALDELKKPGQVVHLPFDWPEDPKQTKWHPPEISPIVKLFLGEIKKAGAEGRKEK